MKISAYKLLAYPLILLATLSNCKKEDEKLIVKKGEIKGNVTFFETNDPLINRKVFLYGSQIVDNSIEKVKIASTTTDSNGQYNISFQFAGEIKDLNIWVESETNENFSGKDINKYEKTEYDLTGYNKCYLQGVIPNTTDSPIEFNTVNQRDIILYPYNTISFTIINDSCYDYNDVIDISIKNVTSNEFIGKTTFIGNCDTSNTGVQYIIPPTILRWRVTKNNITTTHFDTLHAVFCEMLNYTIHY